MPTNRKRSITTKDGRPAAFHNLISDRIKTGMIVGKLEKHIEGKHEMTATQVQAARILLDRTVPVLRAIEVQQNPNDIKDIRTISATDLIGIIESKQVKQK
jgi:hypothetical protein